MTLKRAQNGLPRADTSSAPLWEQNQAFSIGFKGKTRNPPRPAPTCSATGYHASRVSFYLIVPTTEAGAFRHPPRLLRTRDPTGYHASPYNMMYFDMIWYTIVWYNRMTESASFRCWNYQIE